MNKTEDGRFCDILGDEKKSKHCSRSQKVKGGMRMMFAFSFFKADLKTEKGTVACLARSCNSPLWKLSGLPMRLLGDDDHRSGGSRTRGGTWRGTWSGTLRSRAVDGGRIVAAMVMMVVMMAADGGESQGSDNQQSEEFTHGHVSFFVMGER